MKILVYSDIHDNISNLEKVFEQISNLNIQHALVLGDFGSPNVIKKIIEYELPTQAVFGNTDGEKIMTYELAKKSNEIFSISTKTNDIVQIHNQTVYLDHYPDIAPSMAESGKFDAVFHGHTHKKYIKKLENRCILANPGEIGGYITGTPSYIIWNTKTNEIELNEF